MHPPDAAVAAAAYNVLLTWIPGDAPLTLPSGVTTLDTVYANALSALPDAGKADGIAAGAAAATAILQQRTGDGSTGIDPIYTTAPGPGVYQPTPAPEFPAQIIPSFAAWAAVTPFAIRSASQFRSDPGEIFDLGGAAYTREYNEVMSVGDARVRGAAPDSEESDIARYWGAAGGADWNANARIIVNGLGLDRWQHARLFALINISNADALIANQDSKYLYRSGGRSPRSAGPTTAIPHTPAIAGWRPLLPTPPYPDYPCALPTGAGAGAEAIRRFFGTDQVAFTRSVTAPWSPLPAPMAALPAKAHDPQLRFAVRSGGRSGLRARLRRHPFPQRLLRGRAHGQAGGALRVPALPQAGEAQAAAGQHRRSRQPEAEVQPARHPSSNSLLQGGSRSLIQGADRSIRPLVMAHCGCESGCRQIRCHISPSIRFVCRQSGSSGGIARQRPSPSRAATAKRKV